MSDSPIKGSGRIQRAILKLIDDGVADFYTSEDLTKSIYHRPATSAKRLAVISAVQSLARKYPGKIALGKSGLWVIRHPEPQTLKRDEADF